MILSLFDQGLRCGILWRFEEEEAATLTTEALHSPVLSLMIWWSHPGMSMLTERSLEVMYGLRWPQVDKLLSMQNVNIQAETFSFKKTKAIWKAQIKV